MDEFKLDEGTVSAMNAEYERVLPKHLNPLLPKPPFELKKAEPSVDEKALHTGWNALYAFAKDYSERYSFSKLQATFSALAERISHLISARFNVPPTVVTSELDEARAYELACSLYLLLPTPENAVVMTTVALSLK